MNDKVAFFPEPYYSWVPLYHLINEFKLCQLINLLSELYLEIDHL